MRSASPQMAGPRTAAVDEAARMVVVQFPRALYPRLYEFTIPPGTSSSRATTTAPSSSSASTSSSTASAEASGALINSGHGVRP